MTGEVLFAVDHSHVVLGEPATLADAGMRERTHLQEWLIAHPAILGEDIMIVTSEFGTWTGSRKGGGRAVERDRLDILGLDSRGHLVVAELKRGTAPDTVHLQALKYAALVRRFTADELIRVHADFLATRGTAVTFEEARSRLQAHAGPLDDHLLAAPRIVIVAEDYGRVLTTTVLYLLEHGLPITLLRVRPWRLDGRIVVTVSQELPLPDAEDYLLAPEARRQQVRVRAEEDRRRERRSLEEIQAGGLLEPEADLTFRVPLDTQEEIRAAVEAWLHDDPQRGRATWEPDQPGQLRWQVDGALYAPAVLAAHIVEAATGRAESIDAARAWTTEDGHDLASVAGGGVSPFRPAEELVAAASSEIRHAATELIRVARTHDLPQRGFKHGFQITLLHQLNRYIVWLNLRARAGRHRLAFHHDRLAQMTGSSPAEVALWLPSGSYRPYEVEAMSQKLAAVLSGKGA